MSHIFITRAIPEPAEKLLHDAGIEITTSKEKRALTADELRVALSAKPYDGVLCLLHDTINASVFDAAPQAKIFANYAVGFNNIDVAEAKKRGIVVTNTPSEVVNESVAEHAMALLLALAHRVVEGDTFVRAGKYHGWDPDLMMGTDLKGKTLGLIGAGRIGSFVAEKAMQGFAMNVVYYDIVRNEHLEREHNVKYLPSIEDVLKVADAVTLHVLLTEETRHLINTKRLGIMKPGSFLVNTSRGPVVDETALVTALKNKTIRGAALDVYENEPKTAPGLSELSNVILTPHTASATDGARADMSRIAAENLIAFFGGRTPANAVH